MTFNDVTKDTVFYTTTSRFVTCLGAFSQERQKLWLPKDDLRDSSSWSSPPLMLLRDIHSKLITQYDCKEVCAPSQSQVNTGSGARLVRDESSVSNADDVTVIPSQHRVTQRLLIHWQFPGSQTYICGLTSH